VTTQQGRAARSSTSWTVGFTAVLTLGMAVSTITQFAFGAMAPFIRADLGLSRTQLGGLITMLFVAGALLSPIVGPVTDRVGGRRVLVGLFVIDACAFAAIAVAPSYALILVAVSICGVALAGSNPSTNLLIAEHLPGSTRGAVVGIKQSGVQAGSFFAGIAFPFVAATAGWRVALAGMAAVAGVGALSALRVVPADPARTVRDGAAPRLVPAVRWLIPYALFMGAGIASINTYVVLYAHESVGLPERTAGLLLAIMGGVGVVARILWGHHAQRRTSTTGPLAWLALISLAASIAILAAEFTGAWLLWIGAMATGASGAAWNSVGMLTIIRETGRGQAGRASGAVLTSFYAGLVLMPVAFGALVDTMERYTAAWACTAACFALALATTLLWIRRDGGATAAAGRRSGPATAGGRRPR
jgi:predicted MFS family arabinose efflux permease